jgi:hypothetical protein
MPSRTRYTMLLATLVYGIMVLVLWVPLLIYAMPLLWVLLWSILISYSLCYMVWYYAILFYMALYCIVLFYRVLLRLDSAVDGTLLCLFSPCYTVWLSIVPSTALYCVFLELLYRGLALLAAKWWCYMGHLAANRDQLYRYYPAITAVEQYWDKV